MEQRLFSLSMESSRRRHHHDQQHDYPTDDDAAGQTTMSSDALSWRHQENAGPNNLDMSPLSKHGIIQDPSTMMTMIHAEETGPSSQSSAVSVRTRRTMRSTRRLLLLVPTLLLAGMASTVSGRRSRDRSLLDYDVIDCGCPSTCTSSVLSRLATDEDGSYSCQDRMEFVLMKTDYQSEAAACRVVAMEFPNVCGACNIDECIDADAEAIAYIASFNYSWSYNYSNYTEFDSMAPTSTTPEPTVTTLEDSGPTPFPTSSRTTPRPSPRPVSTPAPVVEPASTPAPEEEPVSTPSPVEEPASTPSPVEEPASTPAPVVSTPAPVIASTPAPVTASTPAPVAASTPAPVTPAPVAASTPAPVTANTPAPVVSTPAPVTASTPAPVARTPAPVASTPAPVVTTPAPVVRTPRPSRSPTRRPATMTPTRPPTRRPSTPAPVARAPTGKPTRKPTRRPSLPPDSDKTLSPTPEPTPRPTRKPTRRPSLRQTLFPTVAPEPTSEPTSEPTMEPTVTTEFEFEKLTNTVKNVKMEIALSFSRRDLQTAPANDQVQSTAQCIRLWENQVVQETEDEINRLVPKIETLDVSLENITQELSIETSILTFLYDVQVDMRSPILEPDLEEYIAGPFDTVEEQEEFAAFLRSTNCTVFTYATSARVVLPTNQVAPLKGNTETAPVGPNTGLVVGVVFAAIAVVLLAALYLVQRQRHRQAYPKEPGTPLAEMDAQDDDAFLFSHVGMRNNSPDGDVSTLSDPLPLNALANPKDDASTLGSFSLDYDYQRAYQHPSVSDVQSFDEEPRMYISADDETLQKQFASEEHFTVSAPSGTLGLILEASEDSVPVVSGIRSDSVLFDEVKIGDRLISVDGQDVSDMLTSEVSRLIASKKHQPIRRLIFIRPISDMK